MVSFVQHVYKNWDKYLEGIILVVFIIYRLTAYGVWSDSVSTMDTQSYLNTANLSVMTPEFWTAIRSPTYPILLKILAPVENYQVTHISIPYEHAEGALLDQPGFDRVVIFQMWFAIVSWGIFVLTLFRHINNSWVRLLLSICILFFAFSPQISDWDSIIMTESLAFSLFVLICSVIVELTFDLLSKNSNKIKFWILIGSLVLLSLIWVLLRDTNVYFLVFTVLFLLIGIGSRFIVRKDLRLPIFIGCAFLIGIFIFQQYTFRNSDRWLVPFYNNVTWNIFPYPSRVDFFKEYGMPTNPELLSLRGSAPIEGGEGQADFIEWSKKNGLTVYSRFLLDHPIWAIRSVWENLDSFFAINLQPYFFEGVYERPNWMIPIANLLHPLSSIPVLLNGLFVLVIMIYAIKSKSVNAIAWAWILIWFYGISMMLMALGYLGEMRSTIRHVLGGVVPLRLMIWILFALVSDLLLQTAKPIYHELQEG